MDNYGIKKVAFLHVPKTAGTTLHKYIEDNLGPILFYPPRTSPELSERFGAGHSIFLDKLDTLSESERDEFLAKFHNCPAIGGHTPAVIMKHLEPDRFVFTSLRDPGDRLVSWYFHYVHPDDPEKMHRPFRAQTKEMKFDDFVRFKPMMRDNDNVMVRYFCNVSSSERVNEDHLEVAKRTLDKLDLILFQKNLDEGLRVLEDKLGWVKLEVTGQLKRSKNRRKYAKDFDYTKSIMNAYIKFDRELVAYAKSLPQAITAT